MAHLTTRSRLVREAWRGALAVACACLLVPGEGTLLAQSPPASPPKASEAEAPAKLPAEQLDSLVAPIALYPDPLLAQTLAASTYPLEIIQLQQWLAKHKDLKDKALADAVAKQPWDPSIQSMAAVPEVVKRLSDDIQWTTDLGNAFLAQQSDVMDAVQRMRKKAKGNDALKSNEQQKVETKVVETKEVIVIEQASPEVVYVPSYSPTVVYGPAPYPYPPIYYPPYVPGAALVTFGFGMAMGAAIWGGSCCGCGWGGGNVNVNVNNNFNRVNANKNTNVSGNRGGGNSWQHNSQHRGGAPYADRATASKFGGTARGDSLSNRQASARQQQARGGAGAGNRASGGAGGGQGKLSGGNFPSTSPNVSDRAGASGGRGSDRGASATSSDRGGGGDRGAGASSFDRGGGGSDRIGSRDVGSSSRGSSGSRGGSFGSSGGYSGSSARASSSRGSSSFGGGGGGRGGGGGGRGGGRR